MSDSRASSSTSTWAPTTNGTATNGATTPSSASTSSTLLSKLSFLRPSSLSTSPTESQSSSTMSSSSDSTDNSSHTSSSHHASHHNHRPQHPARSEPPPIPRTATLKANRRRKGSLRKVVLGRGALHERRLSKAGLTIDVPASSYVRSNPIISSSVSTASPIVGSSGTGNRNKENISGDCDDDQTTAFPPFPSYAEDAGSDFSDGGEGNSSQSLESRIGKVATAFGLGISTSIAASAAASAPRTHPHRLPPGALAAAQSLASRALLRSPLNYVSTTDEEDTNSGLLLSTRRRTNTKSPLGSYSPQHQPPAAGTAVLITGDGSGWDYSETEWWGWVVLLATWFVFVIGIGSCFGVWSWAWDVGTTPYAPPELEDDPTLPIVGYYPALIILSGVMAWVWVVVAWVGMKYFRHANVSGD